MNQNNFVNGSKKRTYKQFQQELNLPQYNSRQNFQNNECNIIKAKTFEDLKIKRCNNGIKKLKIENVKPTYTKLKAINLLTNKPIQEFNQKGFNNSSKASNFDILKGGDKQVQKNNQQYLKPPTAISSQQQSQFNFNYNVKQQSKYCPLKLKRISERESSHNDEKEEEDQDHIKDNLKQVTTTESTTVKNAKKEIQQIGDLKLLHIENHQQQVMTNDENDVMKNSSHVAVANDQNNLEVNELTSSIQKMSIRRSNSQNAALDGENSVKINLFKHADDRSISMITRIDNTSDFGPLVDDLHLVDIQWQINRADNEEIEGGELKHEDQQNHIVDRNAEILNFFQLMVNAAGFSKMKHVEFENEQAKQRDHHLQQSKMPIIPNNVNASDLERLHKSIHEFDFSSINAEISQQQQQNVHLDESGQAIESSGLISMIGHLETTKWFTPDKQLFAAAMTESPNKARPLQINHESKTKQINFSSFQHHSSMHQQSEQNSFATPLPHNLSSTSENPSNVNEHSVIQLPPLNSQSPQNELNQAFINSNSQSPNSPDLSFNIGQALIEQSLEDRGHNDTTATINNGNVTGAGGLNGQRVDASSGALNIGIGQNNHSQTFSQNNSIQERVLYEMDEFSEITQPLRGGNRRLIDDNATEQLTGSNLRRLG